MYKKSVEQPDAFWGEIADQFHWETPFDRTGVVQSNMDVSKGRVDVKWFAGGTTNVCYNCVDRHVEAGNGDNIAFYWEGNEIGVDNTCVFVPWRLLQRPRAVRGFAFNSSLQSKAAWTIQSHLLSRIVLKGRLSVWRQCRGPARTGQVCHDPVTVFRWKSLGIFVVNASLTKAYLPAHSRILGILFEDADGKLRTKKPLEPRRRFGFPEDGSSCVRVCIRNP